MEASPRGFQFTLPGVLAATLLAIAGCSKPPPVAPGPDFHAERWFLGHMHSTGVLKPGFGRSHELHVDSTGTLTADGAVRLDQAIHWVGGAVDHRFWIMRPLSGGGYAVTLTDAKGPVAFEVHGPRAHLRYRDRRAPLTIEQWMDLTRDGRALDNHGVVSILGLPVARLEETIVHDPA